MQMAPQTTIILFTRPFSTNWLSTQQQQQRQTHKFQAGSKNEWKLHLFIIVSCHLAWTMRFVFLQCASVCMHTFATLCSTLTHSALKVLEWKIYAEKYITFSEEFVFVTIFMYPWQWQGEKISSYSSSEIASQKNYNLLQFQCE